MATPPKKGTPTPPARRRATSARGVKPVPVPRKSDKPEAAPVAASDTVAQAIKKRPTPVRSRKTASSKPTTAIVVKAKAAAALKAPAKTARTVAAAMPEVTPKRAAVAAAATGGLLAAIGAGFFLWRAAKVEQPDYRLVERDGDFEIREYPAMTTASTETHGQRDVALNRGFDILANYIFAKSRSGEKLAMTAPVLSDGSSTTRWRTRFIMPTGQARGDLPTPPANVTLESEPPRRAAAIRFAGRADDALLASKEGALRSWLQLRHLPNEGKAEHAFYNSPMMPGPLRRNEVIVTLSSS